MTGTLTLRPGFADPVIDSQRAFRIVLDAMARPGRIGTLADGLSPPAPLTVGAAALCLTLVDQDTPLWLAPGIGTPEVAAFLRFHCGCRIVNDPALAAFAVADGAELPALERFAAGDDAWPETSTTVIVQVDALSDSRGLSLTGPGIESLHRLSVDGLRTGIWAEWAANHALFPRGVDLILVAGRQVAALPRTTVVTPDPED